MTDPTQPPVDPTNTGSSVPPANDAPAYPSYPAPGVSAPGATEPAPAYAQPAAYGQNSYGQNPYGQQLPQEKYNVLSIISLITSIFAISLVGIITGHIALSQIKKSGEKGHGLALWGVILGYVGFAGGIIAAIAGIALFIAAASSGMTTYSN